MKPSVPFQRAIQRYHELAPLVGVIGTLWGINLGFQRAAGGAGSLEQGILLADLAEVFVATTLAGVAVFAALLMIERNR